MAVIKLSMAGDESLLQGNLFGGLSQSSPKKVVKTRANQTEELTNEQLQQDAHSRPRKKTASLNEGNTENPWDSQQNLTDSSQTTSWNHHETVNKEHLTPILRHYVELKEQNPGRILLYRLGDFFECFFEDAISLSQLLELTLTGKEGGKDIGRVPMAGIPHHAADKYCTALIQKGFSIAICEQLESFHNKEGKLIKRGITRILTPGTVIETGMLQAKKNNWLTSFVIENQQGQDINKWGIASADISTGEFLIQEGEGLNLLEQELMRIESSEIICEKLEQEVMTSWTPKRIKFLQKAKTPFSIYEAQKNLLKFYGLQNLGGINIQEFPHAIRAAGGLVNYINETNPSQKNTQKENNTKINLNFPQILFSNDKLIIDAQTKRNLEITATQRDGKFHGSLLWSIDRTLTAMGGRCLRRWLEEPLIDKQKIIERQNLISLFVEQSSLRNSLRSFLRAMSDLERLSGRAGAGQAGAREINAIADGIGRLPHLAANLKPLPKEYPGWINIIKNIEPSLIKLSEIIRETLINNPPLNLTDGGLIHDGIDSILDGLRNQLDDESEWLNEQESIERKHSGISTLKLQFHRTFGYFFSVSKSKAKNVPKHWIRRQTLANEERFITPDLKSREGKIFQLKARLAQREYEIFCNLRTIVGKSANQIRLSAKAVAGLDVILSLAELAAVNNYCKPNIFGSKGETVYNKINLEESRHPVVEQMIVEKEFQKNNVELGGEVDLIILTGPNASGKSCYLRQVGLIQILAQIGSWIPAKKASLSIADRIFTRVGAVDDLASGQSTFMVEMSETAYILNHATNQSLVLLDEIGRGTSTYDGLSIAWSVSEFLANKIKSKTIFATHYHELNKLCKTFKNIANFQVIVEEKGKNLIFLHQVIPGGADKSYGIAAAKLAGVPEQVIQQANKILESLESK